MSRPDGRSVTELRPVKLSRGWLDHAEGSVLVEFGRTRVLCAASVTEDVPRWRRGGGLGWAPGEWTDDTSMAIAIAEVAATGVDLRERSAQNDIVERWYGCRACSVRRQCKCRCCPAVAGRPSASR